MTRLAYGIYLLGLALCLLFVCVTNPATSIVFTLLSAASILVGAVMALPSTVNS